MFNSTQISIGLHPNNVSKVIVISHKNKIKNDNNSIANKGTGVLIYLN